MCDVFHQRANKPKVRSFIQSGYRFALGKAPAEFWASIGHDLVNQYPNDDHAAVTLYGDEGNYLQETWLCLHFMAECLDPKLMSDSRASRFMMVCIDKSRYHVEGPVNVTIQSILAVICNSFKTLSEGICTGDSVLRVWCTSLKGDWKFIRQAMSLERHYNSSEICWICLATTTLSQPWTDVSESAAWRSTEYTKDPWPEGAAPSIVALPGFKLQFVQVDLLHSYYLGMARSLASSVMYILVKQQCFQGRNIDSRLHSASRLFKAHCKARGHYVGKHFFFARSKLHWKGGENVELKAKAFVSGVVIQWLAVFMEESRSKESAEQAERNDLMRTLVYVCDKLFAYMHALRKEGVVVLNEKQAEQISVMGEAVIRLYLVLASGDWSRYPCKLFHCRPKVHMTHHSFLSAKSTRRLPVNYTTWMDEDWVKHCMRLGRQTHRATGALNTLRRMWLATLFKLRDFAQS